jgi:hypothetical protein
MPLNAQKQMLVTPITIDILLKILQALPQIFSSPYEFFLGQP